MRISDWSSDVCSSDLFPVARMHIVAKELEIALGVRIVDRCARQRQIGSQRRPAEQHADDNQSNAAADHSQYRIAQHAFRRSEEHTSELHSLMRITYDVFCL